MRLEAGTHAGLISWLITATGELLSTRSKSTVEVKSKCFRCCLTQYCSTFIHRPSVFKDQLFFFHRLIPLVRNLKPNFTQPSSFWKWDLVLWGWQLSKRPLQAFRYLCLVFFRGKVYMWVGLNSGFVGNFFAIKDDFLQTFGPWAFIFNGENSSRVYVKLLWNI